MHDINLPELRAELARRAMPMWKLAAGIGVAPSTFSDYLNGRIRPPRTLRTKVEKHLNLQDGSLLLGSVLRSDGTRNV